MTNESQPPSSGPKRRKDESQKQKPKMPDVPGDEPKDETPSVEEIEAMLARAKQEDMDRKHLENKLPTFDAGRGQVFIQIRGGGVEVEEGRNGRFVASKVHRNATWQVTKDAEGNESYSLVRERMYRPLYAGPSQDEKEDTGYDPACRKPFKVIQIRKHLDKLDFPIEYVDYELYGVLRLFMVGKPVTKDTMLALRAEAMKYLRQFKLVHVDALLLAHVVDSTMTLAILADTSTAKRIGRMWKWKLVKATERRNKALTTGVVKPAFWAFWRKDAHLFDITSK